MEFRGHDFPGIELVRPLYKEIGRLCGSAC
jgi:hypothetical protein